MEKPGMQQPSGKSRQAPAPLLADYSDVTDIAANIIAVLQDPHYYLTMAIFSRQRALDVAAQNELTAVKTIAELMSP